MGRASAQASCELPLRASSLLAASPVLQAIIAGDNEAAWMLSARGTYAWSVVKRRTINAMISVSRWLAVCDRVWPVYDWAWLDFSRKLSTGPS